MLSRKYFEKRCDKLFAEWDAIEDPYGLPHDQFIKAKRKVNEAITISMVLAACDNEREK